MADEYTDFPPEEAHKNKAATIKVATQALAANKKTILQAFDRLMCPTATDPYLMRAEAYILSRHSLPSFFFSLLHFDAIKIVDSFVWLPRCCRCE